MSRKLKEIRRDNLISLIQEYKGQVELSKLVDTPAAYISQIVTKAKTKNGKIRGIGDDLSEKIESKLGKPPGWMDIDHTININEEESSYSLHVGFFDDLSVEKLKILEMLHKLSESDTKAVYTLLTSLTGNYKGSSKLN